MRYVFILLIFIVSVSNAQPFRINGTVKSGSGETVPYVLVIDSLNRRTSYSDINGNFQLISHSKDIKLSFSHAAYEKISAELSLSNDTFIIIKLPDLQIEEVLVKGTSLSKQAMLGVNFLDGRMIQNIPSFFGEPDLVKAITILPGISSGIDMYSGIFVRGGNRDQNLFIVDGARYYTTSHAGGLLSLFNPDMVNHVDVYKGVAPAKYGGAVSSVVDIRYTEGSDHSHLNIDIGTLRTGIFMESKGNKKWYGALAGRIAHLNLISGSTFKKIDYKQVPLGDKKEFSKYSFWDLDGKLVYKPSCRTAFSLNLHLGEDESAGYTLGTGYIANVDDVKSNSGRGTYVDNNNITLNMRHLTKSGISFRSTTWYTNYRLSVQNREEFFSKGLHYSSFLHKESTFIKDISSKLEMTCPIGNAHNINFGAQVSAYKANPKTGRKLNDIEGLDSIFGEQDVHSIESSGFLEGHITLNNKAFIKIGLRFTGLHSIDTTFLFVEPRVQISYQLADDWALRGGFSINNQPFHVLVQTYGYYENEHWILANQKYKPQLSTQFSGGVFGKIPETTIELSMEAYYKKMKNLIFLNPIAYEIKNMFDNIYSNGLGRSYGIEWLVKKDNGKVQWDIAYVWSKHSASSKS